MSITPKAGTRNPAPDRDPRAFDGWHLTNRRARILGCDWRTGNGHVSDRERPFRRSTLCAQSQCYTTHGPRRAAGTSRLPCGVPDFLGINRTSRPGTATKSSPALASACGAFCEPADTQPDASCLSEKHAPLVQSWVTQIRATREGHRSHNLELNI